MFWRKKKSLSALTPQELGEKLMETINEEAGLEEVCALLDAGADVNFRHSDGSFPLNVAAASGRTDIVRLLLDRGADINMRGLNLGYTPLNLALYHSNLKVARLLLELNADPFIPNRENENAFVTASRSRDAAIRRLMAGYEKSGWVRLEEDCIAQVRVAMALDKRITDLFNFKSRERIVMTQNISTGAEAVAAPVDFDDVKAPLLEEALRAFREAGGTAETAHVFGDRKRKPVLRRETGGGM